MKTYKNQKDHNQKRSDYALIPNSGLSAYLEHVKNGNQDVYRTKFFRDKTQEKVLGDWSAQLNTLKQSMPELVNFEDDLRKKVGPMSFMKPLNDRIEDIDHYYDDILLSSKPILRSAINDVIHEWQPKGRGLRLRDRKFTIDKMKKSTNSGLPLFEKRSQALLEIKHVENFSERGAFYIIDRWLKDSPLKHKDPQLHKTPIRVEKYYQHCAVLGWRGQEGGPDEGDVKQRVVWMFPMEVNIRELQVYQVLIEHCQSQGHVPAWISMDAVDREVTRLFDTKGPDDVIICTDFSKFDQHFNKHMQDAAYAILHSLFDDSISEWLYDVFPIKYRIPLMLQIGKVRHGQHGMGSGSGGTNADETLAHRALQHEAAHMAGTNLNPHSMCLGDDGILSYPGINVDDVVRTYSSHGQEMNIDKQYVSKHDCVFLRRWHSDSYRINGTCVGVYSTYRALGRLMYQERFYDSDKWNNRMIALRQLSIIENCKWHPLFEKFIEYCMKGDKYRLGIDIPGFLSDIDSIAEEAKELMPDFLGYTKSMMAEGDAGISSWEVVKFLKRKAKKQG